MKEITTHHDGHGLNESIEVMATGDTGPGGARHSYELRVTHDLALVGTLRFQKGPRGGVNSTPGVTEAAVLAVIRDRLEDFQAGPYPSEEGQCALDAVIDAMWWLERRADNRAERGVLGKNEA